MRKNQIRSSIALIATAVLFMLVFAHYGLQPSTAAPSAGQPLVTGVPEPQQYPIMDKVADKIIQKYQASTCEQLWQEKAQQKEQPKSVQEQKAIAILRNDPQMREAFITKVAAPIANKMFECGMIP
jgi:hypothetical protein